MTRLTVYNSANRKAKEVRNALHAFGVMHPFTLATAAALGGFVL